MHEVLQIQQTCFVIIGIAIDVLIIVGLVAFAKAVPPTKKQSKKDES